jgi:hypothetical protein
MMSDNYMKGVLKRLKEVSREISDDSDLDQIDSRWISYYSELKAVEALISVWIEKTEEDG